MGKYLLGADFGTSGVKAIILDSDTSEKFSSKLFEYPTIHSEPLWAEQVPKEYWKAFCGATKDLLSTSGIDPNDIEAMGISSQGHGLVAIDKNGDDFGSNMIWMDGRTEEQCKYIRENYADDIAAINYNGIKVLFSIPGVLWEKKYRSEKYVTTQKYLGVSSYVNYMLTSKFTVNPSEASLNYCFDVKTYKWSESIADKLQIPINKFPDIYQCHDIIGTLTKKAATETGLVVGTKVIGGGHDTTSSAFAMGVVAEGQAFLSMGTGGNLGVVTSCPQFHEAMTVQCYISPKLWILDAVMNSTGQSLKWFNLQFGQFEKHTAEVLGISPYELYNIEASKAKPGSSGVVYTPYLAGESSPIWDENARASFVGITSRTTRGDIIRSIMEGVAFSVKHNMDVFEEMNSEIKELIVCGGPSKSKLWMQILSDVTGKIVKTTDNEDAAPLGDAMLAGVACGIFKNFKEAAIKNVVMKDTYTPNTNNKGVYKTLFKLYKDTYLKLKDNFKEISKF